MSSPARAAPHRGRVQASGGFDGPLEDDQRRRRFRRLVGHLAVVGVLRLERRGVGAGRFPRIVAVILQGVGPLGRAEDIIGLGPQVGPELGGRGAGGEAERLGRQPQRRALAG